MLDFIANTLMLKDFITSPTGALILTVATALISKNFPAVGNLLAKFFDRFFRPASAPLPGDTTAVVEGTTPTVVEAVQSLTLVKGYLLAAGMPKESVQTIITSSAPYLFADQPE